MENLRKIVHLSQVFYSLRFCWNSYRRNIREQRQSRVSLIFMGLNCRGFLHHNRAHFCSDIQNSTSVSISLRSIWPSEAIPNVLHREHIVFNCFIVIQLIHNLSAIVLVRQRPIAMEGASAAWSCRKSCVVCSCIPCNNRYYGTGHKRCCST